MSYLTQFELRQDEANFGKIVVTLPSPAGTERAFIGIVDPTGESIKDVDFSTPDLNINAGLLEFLHDISTDAQGSWLTGKYVITIYQDVITNPGVYSLNTYEFDFCPVEPTIDLDFNANCICGQITVADNTDYGSATVSRSMTIVPPTIPGQPAPSNIVTSSSSHQFSFSWANVKYQVSLRVRLTTNVISGVVIEEYVLHSEYFDVACTYNLCSLISCIQGRFSELIQDAASAGGILSLSKSKVDEWLKLTKDMALHNALVDCGDYDGAQDLYDQILADIDCNCGCDEPGDGKPVQITPECSASDGFSFNETYPLIISNPGGGGTYNIQLDSAWVSQLAFLSVTDIESPNGSIDITSAYSGGNNTTTFFVDVAKEDFTYIEVAALESSFDDYSLNKVAYRLNVDGDVEVYASIKAHSGVTFATTGTQYPLCQLPVGYRPTEEPSLATPIVSKTDGTVMGYARLRKDGYIVLRPHSNWGANEAVLEFRLVAPVALDIEDAGNGVDIS
jgi:hypothetical protein